MANYANLIAAIEAAVYENAQNEITGEALQEVLKQMVSTMAQAGMICTGVADTDTTPPAASDSNIYYLAAAPGTYTKFGGLTVAPGEFALFIYTADGWTKQTVSVVDIVDNLTSTATNKALSAKQGKVLKEALDNWLKTMGHYSATTTLNLTVGTSGYAVKTDGTVAAKTGFAISQPVAFVKGYRYLIKCAEAVGADVALFAQKLTRRRDVAISYSYTYDSDGDIATATATYGGTTYTYTYAYSGSGDEKVLVSITDQDGNTVAALPLTYAETYEEYKPLFFSGASLPDSGYYVYTSMVTGDIVVSCKQTEMTTVEGVLDDVIAALCYGVADAMEVGSPETRALTEAITKNAKRLESSTDGLDTLGDAKADSLDSKELPKVCAAPLVVYAAGTPAANLVPVNWDVATMGEWTGIPAFIGQLYINTAAASNCLYAAKGTTAISDWITA